jgi:hypothetical protein
MTFHHFTAAFLTNDFGMAAKKGLHNKETHKDQKYGCEKFHSLQNTIFNWFFQMLLVLTLEYFTKSEDFQQTKPIRLGVTATNR